MKHLKLYEDYSNEDVNMFLDIIIKQALRFNKRDMLDYVIGQGFDLTNYKDSLIYRCKQNGWYDPIEMLDPVQHQKLVDSIDELALTNKDIKTLQLNTLTNLRNLHCYANYLTDLKGIEKLTGLTQLYCADNNLTTLEPLKNLTNLTNLSCGNNNLTTLEPLKNLTSLKVIDCSGNNITDLKSIENLTDLNFLYCNNNELSSLEPLKNLTKLGTLNCKHNKLTSLKGIENLPRLHSLICTHNPLLPQEVKDMGDDIDKIVEYYRNR